MEKTHISGVIGLIVIAFSIFAVGTLFDPAEFTMLMLAIAVVGILFAVVLHRYFKRQSTKEKIELFESTKQSEGRANQK